MTSEERRGGRRERGHRDRADRRQWEPIPRLVHPQAVRGDRRQADPRLLPRHLRVPADDRRDRARDQPEVRAALLRHLLDVRLPEGQDVRARRVHAAGVSGERTGGDRAVRDRRGPGRRPPVLLREVHLRGDRGRQDATARPTWWCPPSTRSSRSSDGFIVNIPDRTHLRNGHAPQTFRYDVLAQAHEHAKAPPAHQRHGRCPAGAGERRTRCRRRGLNEGFKVTTNIDWLFAQQVLEARRRGWLG